MKKVTLVFIITIAIVLAFSVSSFAANNNMASNTMNSVRNVMDGAGNVMEDAVGSMSNGIRNGVSAVGNTVNGAMTSDTDNNFANDNTNYNATRTATTRAMTTGGATGGFLGMSETAFSWLVLGIVGAITIALVWFYGKQYENRYNHDNENY